MIKTYTGQITKLNENQVFVFGSNLKGFHGAGSAGYASFNENGNVWRKHNYDKKQSGWQGMWNVKGRYEGYQIGTIGRSYAIPTVVFPGKKRSLSPEFIISSIDILYSFARLHPELEFLVAYTSKRNLNGHNTKSMAKMFYDAKDIPANIIFEKSFSKLVFKNKSVHSDIEMI